MDRKLDETDTQKADGDLEKASPSATPPSASTPDDPWYDPSEKRNPENWPLWIKLYHTAMPCFLSFTITFATSTTVPATHYIAQRFGTTRVVSILPLTLYTLGLAFGPLFSASLSEFFGRKPVYIVSHSMLVFFSLGAGFANNFAALLVLRFLAGFLGSAPVALGAGAMNDIWGRHPARGIGAMMFILGPFLGPTLGPLAGAYLLKEYNNDWRWTQWVVAILGAPILVGLLFMRETYRARIEQVKRPTAREAAEMFKIALIKPTKMLFTDVVIGSLALYTGYAYAMIFSFSASSSYVLPLYYGFNSRQVGLAAIAIVIGYLLAGVVFVAFDRTLYKRAAALAPAGQAAPEHRLYAALVGSVMIPVGLFWYAWEARRGGHWAALVAAGIPFGLGAFSLFLSAITYMADVYGTKGSASALAANGGLRYILGAVFPLFTFQFYENVGPHWAGSTFAFASLALLPIPWLLFKYGAKLRAKGVLVN